MLVIVHNVHVLLLSTLSTDSHVYLIIWRGCLLYLFQVSVNVISICGNLTFPAVYLWLNNSLHDNIAWYAGSMLAGIKCISIDSVGRHTSHGTSLMALILPRSVQSMSMFIIFFCSYC